MNICEAIRFLDKQIPDPSKGLPEELFLFISRVTPMINVDLLIKDKNDRILLSWRDDQFAGIGWHLPGGIVRSKEKIEKRVLKVAETEIGAAVEFAPAPIAINQIIDSKLKSRGHFISLLYKCFLSGKYIPKNNGLSENEAGYLMWHDSCPSNLIGYHEIYRKYF